MNIQSKIKADILAARKAKETSKLPFLSFLSSQIEMVGKNDGNRETTDNEAIRLMKKQVSVMKESAAIASSIDGMFQIAYIEELLPKMATESEVQTFLDSNDFADIKTGMSLLKEKYGELIDMKIGGALVRKRIGL